MTVEAMVDSVSVVVVQVVRNWYKMVDRWSTTRVEVESDAKLDGPGRPDGEQPGSSRRVKVGARGFVCGGGGGGWGVVFAFFTGHCGSGWRDHRA